MYWYVVWYVQQLVTTEARLFMESVHIPLQSVNDQLCLINQTNDTDQTNKDIRTNASAKPLILTPSPSLTSNPILTTEQTNCYLF